MRTTSRLTARPTAPPTLRPVAVAFVVFGFFAGAWAVAVVDIERTFGLSDAQLGFLLAAGIVAATAVAAVGGAITDRLGAGVALTRSLVVWGALLVGEAVAPHVGLFAAAFTLAMAAGGFVDVVMNIVAADALAHEPGRLVRFHGWFNGGAVLGAATTGVALRLGASWRVVWSGVAIVAIVTGLVVRRARVPEPPRVEHSSMLRALASLRHEGMLTLAIVFGAAAMVEGGIATWGILYLRAHLGVGVLAGVTAYVIGEALATMARIGGGPVVGALGSRRSLALGGGLAAAGIATEALCGTGAVAAAGLAAAAVGISVVWPLLLADVNNEARHPALAIGGVTACGYLGMVAGPPIVGTLSGLFGLRVGLLVLAGAALFVAIVPARIRGAARAPRPDR
ncbi:MAG TPA: MFS transporter [Acidimicrobiia bacterium]|nr:MFS transporter [Acidimicrobiia bacterium]